MATRESYVHICGIIFGGISKMFSFMQFSQNIDGFRQNNSQGFHSYNSINKTH